MHLTQDDRPAAKPSRSSMTDGQRAGRECMSQLRRGSGRVGWCTVTWTSRACGSAAGGRGGVGRRSSTVRGRAAFHAGRSRLAGRRRSRSPTHRRLGPAPAAPVAPRVRRSWHRPRSGVPAARRRSSSRWSRRTPRASRPGRPRHPRRSPGTGRTTGSRRAAKCRAANVDLPEPAGPTSTMRLGSATTISDTDR